MADKNIKEDKKEAAKKTAEAVKSGPFAAFRSGKVKSEAAGMKSDASSNVKSEASAPENVAECQKAAQDAKAAGASQDAKASGAAQDNKAAQNAKAAELDSIKKKEEEYKKQISELSDKLSKEKDSYIRLMAEFETFRRRSAEERLSLVSTASSETIKGLLPVLDDCERAMEMLEKSSDDNAKEGTALIYNKLFNYLKTKGLERIEAKGAKFDTDFHEAVTQFPAPSDDLKGKVIDVIQTGYTLNGKVLRFAKVVVGA